MVTIILPALYTETKLEAGKVFKTLSRIEKIEADIPILQPENETILFIYKGDNIIISAKKHSSSFASGFRYILKCTDISEIDLSVSVFDLRKLVWQKHPLLEDVYSRKITRNYIKESWKEAIKYKSDKTNAQGLRTPQLGALYAIQSHWTVSDEAGIVVLPTGTGKTDTMIATLIATQIDRLLLIVPTDALRNQLVRNFCALGVLPTVGIVGEECESPIVGIIEHKFKSIAATHEFLDNCNVVVATMSVMGYMDTDVLKVLSEKISHLFIDEAHHTPAETWSKFRMQFEGSKTLLFTATPFRNDGKRLDGKIIFNFPLKKAQEMDYFRPIIFRPIREYDLREADRLIAEAAVDQLTKDLAAGYDHILMVRVNKIERANEIYAYYEAHAAYRPVIVHSQLKPVSTLKEIINSIIAKQHRIIICVDMLGEGFDLPELKIAAFHDTKKSLTITLQLAGRFTRVKPNLGPATFIANIADPEVSEDLEDLYYQDSDWNSLLPDLSYKMSMDQEDFRKFLEGFKGFPNNFPIQSIRHPLSTIIFEAPTDKWSPIKYKEGVKAIDSFQYKYADYNKEMELLVVILGKRSTVKWAKVQDFESVDWDIIICYFDKAAKLLYLHASNTGSYYRSFVNAICTNAVLIQGESIFRCFYGLNRIRLHNVGVREPMGRAINFIMRVGSDIKSALRDTEIKKAIKSNIFGVGFEHGSRTSIGCSYNGRIWSMRNNNILTWTRWCRSIGAKITDPQIDPDLVLKGTLIPKEIGQIPDTLLFSIEWPDVIFRQSIGNFDLTIGKEIYPIWNCEISLDSQTRTSVFFTVSLPSGDHRFELKLSTLPSGGYSFIVDSASVVYIDGLENTLLSDFLTRYPPLMYFIDGSFLEGNFYTEIKEVIPSFSMDLFDLHDWGGINIKKESQTVQKFTDSIQYSIIQRLIAQNKYDVIIDDDDKGEIGDIVAFQVFEKERILLIDVFHCKYSSENNPGHRLKDFYEVCGQAQKNVKWMEEIDEIFKHLSRRSADRLRNQGVDRFEKGNQDQLDILRRRAKKDLKVRMNAFIVQPGLSFGDYDENGDISKLLAVVQTYLKETWNAELRVIASE